MATTYLDLTNEILRELNEVPLTSSNFSSAVGFQQFVKDAINKSIFDVEMNLPNKKKTYIRKIRIPKY